jgi:hypothetical protein
MLWVCRECCGCVVNVVGVSYGEYIRVCCSNLQGQLSLNNQVINLVGGAKIATLWICRYVGWSEKNVNLNRDKR